MVLISCGLSNIVVRYAKYLYIKYTKAANPFRDEITAPTVVSQGKRELLLKNESKKKG